MILTFEDLPNEILIDLFEYFDIRELYQLFFNHNIRLNTILQSLAHLTLHFREPYDKLSDLIRYFSSQIFILKIFSRENLQLKYFIHLHHLTLWFPTDDQLIQITTETFPYLEHLSISFVVATSSMVRLYQKIFSNGFPSLKSCSLSGQESPINTSEWNQSPNLQYLQITSNYPSILTACPNLISLNFALSNLNGISTILQPHFHLKRLKLTLTSLVWIEQEKNFDIFFSSIPTLEHFSFHKGFSITNSIDCLMNYDWLSTILHRYFPDLKQFIYHLYIFNLFHIDQSELETFLPQIRANFSQIYGHQSQFSLEIKPYNT